MKYKLFKRNTEYVLMNSSGKFCLLTPEQVHDMILNFKTFELERIGEESLARTDAVETGDILASVGYDQTLTLYDSAFLGEIFFDESAYEGIQEFAVRHGKKRSIISRLCNNGRIPGAIQKGTKWYIPKNAEYPKDCRAGRDMSKRYAYNKLNDVN